MTKQEILKAIENGESVWYPKGRTIKQIDLKNTHPIFNGYQIDIMIEDENGWHTEFYGIEQLYKTKTEAEHYLNHANVERVEKLPFITWEEFLKGIQLKFIACDGVSNMTLYYCDNTICLVDDEYPEFNTTSWELTEEKFYKAYDECVRLFKGE